jgi:hypothetical protein
MGQHALARLEREECSPPVLPLLACPALPLTASAPTPMMGSSMMSTAHFPPQYVQINGSTVTPQTLNSHHQAAEMGDWSLWRITIKSLEWWGRWKREVAFGNSPTVQGKSVGDALANVEKQEFVTRISRCRYSPILEPVLLRVELMLLIGFAPLGCQGAIEVKQRLTVLSITGAMFMSEPNPLLSSINLPTNLRSRLVYNNLDTCAMVISR